MRVQGPEKVGEWEEYAMGSIFIYLTSLDAKARLLTALGACPEAWAKLPSFLAEFSSLHCQAEVVVYIFRYFLPHWGLGLVQNTRNPSDLQVSPTLVSSSSAFPCKGFSQT